MKPPSSVITASALSLFALTFVHQAVAQGSGFTGPDNLRQVTVAEAAELPDDTDVKLTGYIVRSLGDEKYEFRDDTGTIVVEIDDEDWGNLEVTPEVRVEISGEIEEERNGNELEAEKIRRTE